MINKLTIEQTLAKLKKGEAVILVDDEKHDAHVHVFQIAQYAFEHQTLATLHDVPGATTIVLGYEKFGMITHSQKNAAFEYDEPVATIGSLNAGLSLTLPFFTKTIETLINPKADDRHFRTDVGYQTLPVRLGGALKRAAAAEATMDIATILKVEPVAIMVPKLDPKGRIFMFKNLLEDKQTYDIFSISDLIAYRLKFEVHIEKIAEAKMPTKFGEFKMIGFVNKLNGEHHVALVKGNVATKEPVLLRVHSECLTGDSFGSLRCDCGNQLHTALKRIEKQGRGILLYMRQEGRGIGLINKIRAYALQDKGMDTVEANLALGFPDDLRDYGTGAQILQSLGVTKLEVMTNNPLKIRGLSGFGIEIVKRQPIQPNHNERSDRYMQVKKDKMGHILNLKKNPKPKIKSKA